MRIRRFEGVTVGRAVLVVAVSAFVLATLLPTAVAESPPPPGCARESWVAGTVDLCAGTLVYRDYVYDDYGAHHSIEYRTAVATGPLARPYGAERYPEGSESTADIVDLSIRIDGDELEAVFELNALYQVDQTTAVLLLDTDNDPDTQARPRLGALSEPQWRGAEVVASSWRGDPAANTITLRLPVPPGDTWRIGAYTTKRDGRIMNVAFRGREQSTLTTGAWFEDRQAVALRDGDISEFAHVVEVADLRGRVTRPAPAVTGFQQRVYTSAHTLPPGEGMSYTQPHHGRHGDTGAVCEQEFHYFGKYQPYGVYVPEQPGPHGVQLALHGCSAGMTSLVNGPGMQQHVGEARNRIVVVPLGRGPYGYYSDISERDVLDVLDDVLANHDVDRSRVFAGGYSMGGYGAYRMAALYPHRFAGAISWVGFTGDAHNNPAGESPGSEPSGAIGNVIDFVRNLRHIPTAMLYSGADELVHAQSAVAMEQRFAAEQGGAYEWYFHPAADHFTYGLADDWRKESAWTADLELVRRPARVVYRTDESLAYPEYGIRHDRAYWVSGIDPRESGYADVDAQTFACDVARPVYLEGGRQGPDPVPWHSENRLQTGTRPEVWQPRLELDLANVADVTIDLQEACMDGATHAERHFAVTTDGPVTVRFSDGSAETIPAAGTYEWSVVQVVDEGLGGDGGARAVTPAEGLPASGGALGAWGLGGLVAAAALRAAIARPGFRRRSKG